MMAMANPVTRPSNRSRQGLFSHRCLRKASSTDPVIIGLGGSAGIAGHVADDEAHALRTALDLLIVLAYPVPHDPAAMPGGVISDQPQRGEALGGELGRAPGQKIDRH